MWSVEKRTSIDEPWAIAAIFDTGDEAIAWYEVEAEHLREAQWMHIHGEPVEVPPSYVSFRVCQDGKGYVAIAYVVAEGCTVFIPSYDMPLARADSTEGQWQVTTIACRDCSAMGAAQERYSFTVKHGAEVIERTIPLCKLCAWKRNSAAHDAFANDPRTYDFLTDPLTPNEVTYFTK